MYNERDALKELIKQQAKRHTPPSQLGGAPAHMLSTLDVPGKTRAEGHPAGFESLYQETPLQL